MKLRKTAVICLMLLLSCQMAACSKQENANDQTTANNQTTQTVEPTEGTISENSSMNETDKADASNGEAGQADTQWSTFSGKGYTISYPGTWETQELSEGDFNISPKELEDDGYIENIMVVTQDLSETGEDLEALKEKILEDFNSMEGFEQISCKETTFGGQKAYELTLKCTTDEIAFQSQQIFTVKGNTGYIFGFSGDEKGFAKYTEEADKIAGTFAFTE